MVISLPLYILHLSTAFTTAIITYTFLKITLNTLLQCRSTDALDVFFEDVQVSDVTKIAVIGCGCSVATVPVAQVSHYWNISQVIKCPCIIAMVQL